jgi:hypothetical protein
MYVSLISKSDLLDICMDATRMDFRDNSFDICLDKGTYDALAVIDYWYDPIHSVGLRVKEYLRNLSKRCLE